MSQQTSNTTVFVLGGTGSTGKSIVNALLDSGKYTVFVGSRPSSVTKPDTIKLQSRGAQIRAIDVANAKPAELDAVLKGVDVVISCGFYTEIDNQKQVIDAAKRVGVKRFLPNDWGTPCIRGVRDLYDQKAGIHDYLKAAGIGYTIVDVGFWYELMFPIEKIENSPYADVPFVPCNSHKVYGTGDVKTAIIDRSDIGKFVAEIISDERTLNRYVLCWGAQLSQHEMWVLAEKAKKEAQGESLTIKPKQVTEEELKTLLKTAPLFEKLGEEYMYSCFIRGDNTPENAKKPEYGSGLDARELCSHVKVVSAEDYTKALYSK